MSWATRVAQGCRGQYQRLHFFFPFVFAAVVEVLLSSLFFFLLVSSWVLDFVKSVSEMSGQYYEPHLLYGPHAQDGPPLTVCTCPAGSLPHLCPTHRTVLAQAPAGDSSNPLARTASHASLLREASAFVMVVNQRGCEGHFPGNQWAHLMSLPPVNGSFSSGHWRLLPWSACRLQHTCHSGTLFQMWDPLSRKPLMSLLLRGLSRGWVATRLVGPQAATPHLLCPKLTALVLVQ